MLEQLKKHYPKELCERKKMQEFALFEQCGPYNYPRMAGRGDMAAANLLNNYSQNETFDSGDWFVVSLRGAAGWICKTPADTANQTYFRPSMLRSITSAALFVNGRATDLRDAQKLGELSRLLTSTEDRGAPIAGCPFTAVLNVTTAEGKSFSMELATDSCCIYRIDNRDYAYARYLAGDGDNPENDLLFALFGVSLSQ